jgi:alkylhydroperoxidase family enzyme
MSRIAPAAVEGNAFQQIMGHRPEIVEKWFALDSTMRFSGLLAPDLKEEIRRALADGIGCRFCASLGAPDPGRRDVRMSLAVSFAEIVLANFQDLRSIEDEVFAALKAEFSDAEIVELSIWTLFMIAGQAFGALMRVRPSTPEELKDYVAWRAAGEAAAKAAA